MTGPRHPSRRRPAAALLAAALAAGLLGGCGGGAPVTRDAFFVLEPAVAMGPATRHVPATLLVMPLGARGFLGGTQIVFRTGEQPLQVQRYDDLLWEEAPGRALSDVLATALRDSGAFAFVVTIADRARADYILGGELIRFEHLPTAAPPRVSGEVNLTLVDGRTRRTLFSRTYAGDEPTGDSTPVAMAAAFNRLAERLAADALADLAGIAPTLPGAR